MDFQVGRKPSTDGHVDSRSYQQTMREKGLEVAEVREAVDAHIGCQQGLQCAANAQEIDKLVYGIFFEYQHKPRQPDEHTAHVQGQHGLDGPRADGEVPDMPG